VSGINPGDELSERLNVGTYTRRGKLGFRVCCYTQKEFNGRFKPSEI